MQLAYWSVHALQGMQAGQGCPDYMQAVPCLCTRTTCLLVVKEATVDAAWHLIAPIKHNILFHTLVVIPCTVTESVSLGTQPGWAHWLICDVDYCPLI